MTQIVAFSDIHGLHKAKGLTRWFMENPADFLLFAGDIQLNHMDTGVDFIQWLGTLPYKHKIMIFGNHDGNYLETILEKEKHDNIKILQHEPLTLEGIKFFGSPYSLMFGEWWFMKYETELERLYQEIPQDTDILITHTPPYKVLDKTHDGDYAGSFSLLERIQELKHLKHHVFGHIHEGWGTKKEGKVEFNNVSLLDEKYRLVHMPVIFELEKE